MKHQTRETRGFQAEVKQLLNLMIHSLYSNKEIFLRELISNASDACDKLRFEALTNAQLFENDSDLKIRVSFDPKARTITVSDNGIGMSRDEVIAEHRHDREIGHARILRAAHRRPGEGRPPDRPVRRRLLFVVHRRRPVTLITRRAGLTAGHGRALGVGRRRRVHRRRRWSAPERGTEVTLHLREGEDELLSGTGCASIIRKYSDHIRSPSS